MKFIKKIKALLLKPSKDFERSALEKELGNQAAPLQIDIEAELEKQRLKHIQYMGRRSF